MKKVILLAAVLIILTYCGCGGTPDADLSGLKAEDFYELGLSWLNNKQAQRAEMVFRKAIALKPGYADAYIKLGYAYYFMYEQFLASTEYKDDAPKYYNLSYNCFKEGAKYKPDDPECYTGLARLELAGGRYENAVKYLLIARGNNPVDDIDMEATICYELGRSYVELGKLAEALKEYKTYLDVAPLGEEQEDAKMAIKYLEEQLSKDHSPGKN
ncbi:MAG: tetratricopeptide repeat protein [Candidatus Brocadiia bacterium]